MKKIILLIFCVIPFLSGLRLQAQEVREFFNGARSLAMGGASIAVVNDETALYSNPAGLGKIREFYGTLFDPELEVSANTYSMYTSTPFTSLFDIGSVVPSLVSNKNIYYHARFQIAPSIVLKNFGFGLFYNNILDLRMNTLGTLVETYYRQDSGIFLGYNFRFFDGRIKLGFVGKAISRVEIDKNIVYPLGPFTLQSQATEGAALSGDIGLVLTAPWAWLPTLAVVGRDIGGTNFTAGKGISMAGLVGIPNSHVVDYDVALAVFPIHESRSRSSFTLELQKVLAYQLAVDKTRYYHVGYEYNHGDFFFFRMGANGAYWSAGLEIAAEKFQLQYSTYGEEVGLGSVNVEDRRQVLKMALRF